MVSKLELIIIPVGNKQPEHLRNIYTTSLYFHKKPILLLCFPASIVKITNLQLEAVMMIVLGV